MFDETLHTNIIKLRYAFIAIITVCLFEAFPQRIEQQMVENRFILLFIAMIPFAIGQLITVCSIISNLRTGNRSEINSCTTMLFINIALSAATYFTVDTGIHHGSLSQTEVQNSMLMISTALSVLINGVLFVHYLLRELFSNEGYFPYSMYLVTATATLPIAYVWQDFVLEGNPELILTIFVVAILPNLIRRMLMKAIMDDPREQFHFGNYRDNEIEIPVEQDFIAARMDSIGSAQVMVSSKLSCPLTNPPRKVNLD